MTYPGGGGPGGYPGQGPQQPQPGYGPPVAGGQKQLNIPQIAYLVTAGLGVLNLFLAFASMTSTSSSSVPGVDVEIPGTSFYEGGVGWIPGLLLISGLTALFNILPGDNKPGMWPAIFAAGAVLPFLFMLFSGGSLGIGGVMVLIFGILQLLASVGAYLIEADVIKMPPPGQQSPYGGHPGYGPPPAQYPQQQPQPGQYGQPGAQTQYQPQPGQFPPQQHPGTPPGGYPQQG